MKNNTTRLGRWQTESGFRLIPTFTAEHNARRFRKHVERLQRTLSRDVGTRCCALKARRIHGRSVKRADRG
jgi:hypothetical protein